MKTRYAVILALVAGASLALGFWTARAAPESSKAVIDASRYPDLQSAFDALPQGGGLIQLPPGDFELTRPLILSRGDVRIAGAAAATHLINRNVDGQPALILRHPARPGGQGRLWRIQLADLRISGNPKSGDGILADGINELVFNGLAIDHHGGHGINLEDCYENPRITNSSFTYNGKAGLRISDTHDIVVSANHFEENHNGVQCVDSFNLVMNGNDLDDHLGDAVVVEDTCCSVISGNMIEESKGAAIVIDRDCYGVTISANLMAANNGGGVDLRGAWGSAVSANTFSLMPRPALAIRSTSGRITVTGNNFSNSHVRGQSRRKENFADPPPGTSSYASGILLQGTSDIAISGNLFAGLIEEAVKTEGPCRRIALVGNVASDLGRRKGQKLPAFTLGGAGEVTVGQNAFEKGFEVKRTE